MGRTDMRKQSKRVAVTKESIEVAYLDLLEEGGSGKITVKEVCERAGVNRTTFYKYYADGTDLGQAVRRNILEYLEQLLQETIPENHSDAFELISRVVLQIYRDSRIRKLPLLYREDQFRMQVEQLLMRYYFNHRFGPHMSEEDWIHTTYARCGLMGLIESWIKDGMTISPEKISGQVIMLSKRIRELK